MKTRKTNPSTSIRHPLEDDLQSLLIPVTGSPVPDLTSLHTRPGRGPYGASGYPGNCSGLLVRDLLRFYRPKSVLDPMTGGGTCRDVCRELRIPCQSLDLKSGADASSSEGFRTGQRFDFIWLHPPYWRLIRYSDDVRCLSNAGTLREFVQKLRQVFHNCSNVLSTGGHIAVLMGDGKSDGAYWGLPFRTLNAAAAEGLWLAAPEIVRVSYGATSSNRVYSHAFIPRLHDICLILKRRDR